MLSAPAVHPRSRPHIARQTATALSFIQTRLSAPSDTMSPMNRASSHLNPQCLLHNPIPHYNPRSPSTLPLRSPLLLTMTIFPLILSNLTPCTTHHTFWTLIYFLLHAFRLRYINAPSSR